MSERLRSLLFAGALCLVCSILLTAASTGLQPFQEHNLRLEKKRNILKAVGLIGTEEVSAEKEIERFYNEKIRSFWVGPGGELKGLDNKEETDLPLYVRIEERDIKAYVVPIESRGLWGKIHGYLAIEKDGTTIAGFTVFKHAETPGLGGEIEKDWFQKKWVGKKIVDREGAFVSVGIARGAVKDAVPEAMRPHFVDGISGATLTGRYLTAGIREVLKSYEPVAIRFRKQEASGL